MKFSEKWLYEWVEPELSGQALADCLTMAGLEVDAVTKLADDHVFDIDLTPNRADCLSIAGIAREIAALTRSQLKLPKFDTSRVVHQEKRGLNLQAETACPHYVGRIIKGVNNQVKTPAWLQERLEKSGVQLISPVVDVTNYVMLELGQPMHAFDLGKIDGDLVVRWSQRNEKITLLNETDLALKPNTLLIADHSKPLALAGIMGGLVSAVAETTKDIFLESAFFNPVDISLRSREYGVHTDSSHRFARGVDPTLQVEAIERATGLLLDIVGGEAGPLTEAISKDNMPLAKKISFRPSRAEQLLGILLSEAELVRTFNSLGMQVEQGKPWQVAVPPYRFDVVQEEDLVEEVARLIGYDKFPAELPALPFDPPKQSEHVISNHDFAQCLQHRGYTEVMTYSFVDQTLLALFDTETPVMLSNPISQEMAAMRTSLWPSLIKALQHNINRQLNRLRIFEIGSVFTLKKEHIYLGGLVFGSVFPEQWGLAEKASDFFDVKADLEAIFHLTFFSEQFEFKKEKHVALHPGRSAGIYRSGKKLGYLGELHPRISQVLSLPTGILLFELNVALLQDRRIPHFKKTSKFPFIRRDLAFIIDNKLEVSALLKTIRDAAGNTFKDLWVFDVYEGKGIQAGQKSVALGLILQDSSRTLREEDVNECVDRVIQVVQDEHSATLRN